MMSENYSKWLTGCGVGCAALLIIGVLAAAGGYLLIRDTIGELKQFGESAERIEQELGSMPEFTPEADGRIPPERIEAFLAVRHATMPLRDDLRVSVQDLENRIDGLGRGRSLGSVFRGVGSGLKAIPKIARLHQSRAEALLEHQMGPAEYSYLYSLAYFSWLKKDPGDGPKHLKLGESRTANWDPDNVPGGSREERRLETVRQVRHQVTTTLRRAVEHGKAARSRAEARWIAAVEKELLSLDSQWRRMPWEDDLPTPIRESFAPFRERLEKSYDPLLNSVEFMELRHP
jgi:hypothetical protein